MPFGTPVVPDVYRMYSGSVAATGVQPTGDAASATARQSRSRSAMRSHRSCSRWSTTQCSGLCAARSIALSSSGLYGTMRVTSMPQLAVRTTLGLASSMRTANSADANPPNTTECTAPIRAHAYMPTSASTVIGM